MNDQGYWVKVSFEGKACGAGFMLTRRYALTAAHCLRRVPEGAAVLLSRDDGDSVEGTVLEINIGRDVALIRVNRRLDWIMLTPATDLCTRDDLWCAPYRPSLKVSELRGRVLTSPTTFECQGGQEVEALELEVSQILGNYAGYSGSPVQREAIDTNYPDVRAVVGMLIEQDPHRVREDEFTNVLFAITIADAMDAFDDLQGPPQFARIAGNSSDWPTSPTPTTIAKRSFAGVRAGIDEVKAMVEDGVLPGFNLAECFNEAVRMAMQRTIEGSGARDVTV